jgi:acetyl esterase/lipase
VSSERASIRKTLTPVLLAVLALAPAAAALAGCGESAGGAAPSGSAGGAAPSASPSAAASATPASSAGAGARPAYSNVAYAGDSPAQKLDIYLPKSGAAPYPVIVAIHGGGFMSGGKADRQIAPMIQSVTHGYAVVSINYRLSGEARFPAQINDVKAAIRWVRANAARYGFDPTRIAAWGDSAGGNLAALAGTSGGVARLSDPGQGNASRSDRVQAVVDWFGPISFRRMAADFRANGADRAKRYSARTFESQYLGAALRTVPGRVRAADPTTYISPGDPPFLIEHGTADATVPVQQSKRFAAALRRTLGPRKVTLKLLRDAGHLDATFFTAANRDLVLDWLDARMK